MSMESHGLEIRAIGCCATVTDVTGSCAFIIFVLQNCY